jgi:pyridoxine 5-phosphate synthase
MANKKIRLGVNIDHIAFIKKSRDTLYPNLIDAVRIAEHAGADLITIHLREDRRHIQDKDALDIRQYAKVLNFEMANTAEMIQFAINLKPNFCCIVPEKREEKTTEGGLSLSSYSDKQITSLKTTITEFRSNKIKTSLFIDPDNRSIDIAKDVGAELVELHTGKYANQFNTINEFEALEEITSASRYAHSKDLLVNVGHGLNYENLSEICKLDHINEVNIGHAIIAQAVFTGLNDAIKKIISIINNCD